MVFWMFLEPFTSNAKSLVKQVTLWHLWISLKFLFIFHTISDSSQAAKSKFSFNWFREKTEGSSNERYDVAFPSRSLATSPLHCTPGSRDTGMKSGRSRLENVGVHLRIPALCEQEEIKTDIDSDFMWFHYIHYFYFITFFSLSKHLNQTLQVTRRIAAYYIVRYYWWSK